MKQKCETSIETFRKLIRAINFAIYKTLYYNKQILLPSLFNIIYYSPEFYIYRKLFTPRMNNIDIKKRKHEILGLLYDTSTK